MGRYGDDAGPVRESIVLDLRMYCTAISLDLTMKVCGENKPQNRRYPKYSENRTRATAEVGSVHLDATLSSQRLPTPNFLSTTTNDIETCDDSIIDTVAIEVTTCRRNKSTAR
jgi:hypothetical protein